MSDSPDILKTFIPDELTPQNFKEAAMRGISDLFSKACAREDENTGFFDYWSDGESVLRPGLLPVGDGLLSLTEMLDILQGMVQNEESDAAAMMSKLQGLVNEGKVNKVVLRSVRDFFNVFTKTTTADGKSDFYYSGFPYVTKGHLSATVDEASAQNAAQDPEMTASVAYAVLVADGVYRNQGVWRKGMSAEVKKDFSAITKDTAKSMLTHAADRLCATRLQGTKGIESAGWAWRSSADSNFKTDPLLKPELMATSMACSALTVALENQASLLSKTLREKCDHHLSEGINWITATLSENFNANNLKGWREYGTEGRVRLIDQVMGLRTLFYAPDATLATAVSQHGFLISEVLQNILRLMLNLPETAEPDYHLLRASDFTGLVVWEDYSLPYWCLGLLNRISIWSQDIGKQEQSKKREADYKYQAQNEVLWGAAKRLHETVHAPMAQAVINSAFLKLLGDYRNNTQFLWPKGEYHRVYATGEAIKALLEISRNPKFFSGVDMSDKLFIAMQKTISHPLFSADFAENASRYIVNNFAVEEILETPGITAATKQQPTHNAVADETFEV